MTVTQCQAELARLGWAVHEDETNSGFRLVARKGSTLFVINGASRLLLWQNAVSSANQRAEGATEKSTNTPM